ncbi:hypothetical protein ACFQGT_17740 [Natrialbaceae archaeon GCM10025810]|uniref:hypothetical protein n=1 Tax=Halovalidus salilacus TaxID=3075124 RepID=UPI003606DC75
MRGRLDAVPPAVGRDRATLAAVVVLVAGFAAAAGPIGALAGLATAVVGFLLGPPYAFAIGHIALVALFPDGIEPRAFALVEIGFVAVLIAPAWRTASPGRVAAVAVGSALALAGVAWAVVDGRSVALAAGALLVTFALTAYGLHRLELVRLGLVTDETNGAADDGAGTDTTPPTGGRRPTTAPSADPDPDA